MRDVDFGNLFICYESYCFKFVLDLKPARNPEIQLLFCIFAFCLSWVFSSNYVIFNCFELSIYRSCQLQYAQSLVHSVCWGVVQHSYIRLMCLFYVQSSHSRQKYVAGIYLLASSYIYIPPNTPSKYVFNVFKNKIMIIK